MHELGWVHRDISYGNILIVGTMGKITDFEYAKEEMNMSTHGIRTVCNVICSIGISDDPDCDRAPYTSCLEKSTLTRIYIDHLHLKRL